jgi:acyl-CoA thioester hydrolase
MIAAAYHSVISCLGNRKRDWIDMQEFVYTISPRLYETDAMGHINNATIAAWFEVVRVEFLKTLVAPGSTPEKGINKNWILASVHIDFKGETFYGPDVDLKIVDASIGNTSLTVSCEMHQEGRLTVQGEAVVVYMDYDTKTTVRIPESMRERLLSEHA